MRHATGEQRGSDGQRLFVQSWEPDGEPRALVALAHGLAEHSGRYNELVGRLVARGLAVYALDHRGHGRSGGRRSFVERFEWLVADYAARAEVARAAWPGRDLLLLGHSMGGAIALATALAHPTLARALLLSAPAIGADPDVPRLRIWSARLLAAVAPAAGVLTLPSEAISQDTAVVRRYDEDPLVYRGAVPARTAIELLGAIERFPARVAELRMPTLVLHGTADQLVPLRSAEPVYARFGCSDLTIHRYQGFYHEVFNEPGRAQVFADLDAWLDRIA